MDLILLVFLCFKVSNLAARKGLSKGLWVFYTVSAWIFAEIAGMGFGVFVLNSRELLPLACLGLACGFGSYLLIKRALDTMPDKENDIDNIGSNQ